MQKVFFSFFFILLQKVFTWRPFVIPLNETMLESPLVWMTSTKFADSGLLMNIQIISQFRNQKTSEFRTKKNLTIQKKKKPQQIFLQFCRSLKDAITPSRSRRVET